MNIPTRPNTLRDYERQNQEIIKSNTRLNERVAMLEVLVSNLQQENLQLRIDKAKKPKRRKKKRTIPKKRKLNAMSPSQSSPPLQPLPQPSLQENIPTDTNSNEHNSKELEVNDLNISTTNTTTTTHSKRSCSSKPISYVLPSAKRKLRKGDPFTFGNE